MFRTLLAALAVLSFASIAHAQTTPRAGLQMQTLAHEGVRRQFGLYAPPNLAPGQPASLLLVLHGRFSSAQAMHGLSHLQRVADARGALLVYPETVGGFWNDGGHAALGRRETQQDDAGFIQAALAELGRTHMIDAASIHIVGFDAGGGMALQLACSGQVQAASITLVSALMWEYSAQACASTRATPLLIVHGREDETFPVRGEVITEPVRARRFGADETISFWARANGCANVSATGRGDSVLYANCGSGAQVAYVGVPRGGHLWFHADDAYQLNRNAIDTAALIERFAFDRVNFALPAGGGRDRPRDYIVYTPPNYDPARPTPLVVMLHGRGGNGAGMASISQMNRVAREHNFIVVYPNGVNNEWNAHFDLAGTSVSLTGQRSRLPQNDVQTLKTLTEDLGVDFNIDRRRMYVAGFSNGGFMTLRMTCSASDTFAGFAEVAAALYVEMNDVCRRSAPAPLLIMHGTGDDAVRYEGVTIPNPQGGEPLRITLGVMETVSFFVRRNNCSFAGQQTQYAESGRSPGTHVVRFEPRDCAAPLSFYLINGGGHTWPGEAQLPVESFGPTNMDIRASEVIWDFFSHQTLPEAPR
ncbi:MAG: hypothetical protein J0L81_14695 [Caulobacterales bacterium]|jgi:polyhydroxybutyrate depolymerase|nr:hypothetical protein [Caulobacterales bacterium]